MYFSFYTFFNVFCQIPGPTVCASHFGSFSVFLTIFQVLQFVYFNFHSFQFSQQIIILSEHFSFSTFFSVSLNYRGHTVCASHFGIFSLFLAIFHVKPCDYLIFLVFEFSRHTPGPTVFFSHLVRFSVFHAIFQVLPCEFLIFLAGQFSHHIPAPTVFIYHFPRFSVFLAKFQVLQCAFLIFYVFHCFSPYCRSCSMYFSFFTASRHMPSPTFHVFHFPRFSVFSPNFNSYSEHFLFSTFFSVSPIFQVIQCVLLILHVFLYFSHYNR